MTNKNWWKILSMIELLLAAVIIIFDLFNPTLLVLGMIVLSLLVRKASPGTLGFKKNSQPVGMFWFVLLCVVLWTFLQLGLFMPILNHLTGTTQDLSAFEDLKGNLSGLLVYLAFTWTLAAFGEEIVYRGYLQRRFFDLLGEGKVGIFAAVGVSSVLFGLAHTEQGFIGVVLTFLDAIFFSLLKLKNEGNLWASIVAHGLSNTIGLVGFYFLGPIYGLW